MNTLDETGRDAWRAMQAQNRQLQRTSLKDGDGSGTFDGMDGRVSRLEAHMEHVREDMRDIKGTLGQIADKLNQLPTRDDLWSWKLQWAAIGFGVMAIVIGGIIGGLSWIQPTPEKPSAPQPIVITVPKAQ